MSKTRRSTEFKNNSRVIDMDEAREKRQAKRRSQREAAAKRSARKKKQPETRGKRAIRRKRNRTRWMIALLVLIIIGVLAVMGMHVFSLMKEKNKVEAQHEALLKEKARLEQELANASDKNAIEDIARQKLRLVKPGETLYMFSNDFGKDKKDDED